MKQGFEGCIGVYVKGVPVFEDSAFVGGGTDTGVEPGEYQILAGLFTK